MKKALCLCLTVMLFLMSSCSFKVKNDTIHIPEKMVSTIELQREYVSEDGTVFYRSKVVNSMEDVEKICNRIRSLPAEKVPAGEAAAIHSTPLIIILYSEIEHRLILNEEMAFFDQMAYNYTKSGTFEKFLELYDNLAYEENDTEAKPLG